MSRFFTILFFLTCTIAGAQNASISFSNLTINQGLSQNSVVSISFDDKGFVWLATQDGLNRYDGKDFMTIDRKFDDITSGSRSRLGKVIKGDTACLWIISKGGRLEKLNLINNSLEPIEIAHGEKSPIVTCLLPVENGLLWLGTEMGEVMLYDSKRKKIIQRIQVADPSSNGAVNALHKDKNQRIWIASTRVGYIENRKLYIDSVYYGKSLKSLITFSSIAEDRNGNIWLGSLGYGLFVKRNGEVFRPVYKPGLIPSDLVIEALLADEENRLWIGTYGSGLFIYDDSTNKVQQFVNDKKKPFSLAFNDVLTIEEDENKGIWIGTDGGGVSIYNKLKNTFTLFSEQNVPEEIEIAMVRSIATDKKGIVWIGTSNKGLTRIDIESNEFKTWRFPSFRKSISNPDRVVSLLVNDDGIVWLGTQGNGLILFDSRKQKIHQWFHPQADSKSKIPDGTAWCIFRKSATEIWIGTESNGLSLFDKQKGYINSYISPYNPNGTSDAIRSITQIDDSTLCIGFAKEGIQLFNMYSKKYQQIPSKKLAEYFAAEATVKTLYYQAPYIWMGTDGKGLLVYNILNGSCVSITVKDGLPNNTIYGILPDDEGYLWVSTNKGLSRFKKDIIHGKTYPLQFTNYNSEQGLQSNEFNTGAYSKAANGTLFFGGINGLNVFNPGQFQPQEKSVAVVFTRILIDNEPLREDSSAVYKTVLKLSPKNHSIAFNFAALNFSYAQHHHYYYKLEPYDKEWIDADQRNYVSYTNIPTGNYTFFVKYQQPQNSGAPITQIHIQVNGPFYKSWWFITLLVIVLGTLIYSLYRYRIFQILRIFKIRQSIATDLHDNIGSTLTNINILSELSKKSLDRPNQAQTFLNRISEEVEASSQSLDDIIWSINTQNDTWQETFSRMRRYAAEVFENSQTAYFINLDDQEGMVKLNMEKRRDIFLIYKELLNNIHKHAAATEVKVDMWFREQKLIMTISDNGKGFIKNGQTHRNGLKNLSIRVSRWNGTVEIDTGSSGTTVKVGL